MARATAIDKLSLEHKRLLDEKLTTEGFEIMKLYQHGLAS